MDSHHLQKHRRAEGTPRKRRIPLFAMLLAAVSVVLQVSPASAHSELSSSNPADGARLAAVPADLVLTFNQNISPQYANVVLTPANGSPVELRAKVDGPRVSAARPTVAAQAASTRWTLAYRVVSADGHPIAGKIGFTVRAPAATATPEITPPSETSPGMSPSSFAEPQSPTSGPSDESSSGGVGMMVAIAVVAAAILGIPVLLLRRRGVRR
ncbi:copper resistance protein CopC [Nocardioides sp. NPDC057772]|uniref:copper resistance CopC family protein n=1 Tax=Nocardioides sp. NPDC057772 TaxID=3346245 RepID=UPI0002028B3F|nr:copper resistance protein, CopC-family [Nocardioidaceae bacterium Broad-1]